MRKSEIKPLTGIRAAAALWVVLFHLKPRVDDTYPAINTYIDPLISNGYLGVDLFFILSGFIIYYNYEYRLSQFRFHAYVEYLWMRLARIWPVHLAILFSYALLLVVMHAFHSSPEHQSLYSWQTFVANIFLVHAWFIPITVSWNTPAWSISCEWLVYLLFPLFLMLPLKKAPTVIRILQVFVTLVGTAAICQYLQVNGGAGYGIIRVVGEFFGGSGLCLIYLSEEGKTLPWKWIAVTNLVAVMLSFYVIFPFFHLSTYWCVPLLGILVLGLAQNQGFIARFFSTRIMLYGGYISYSIYMTHEACMILMDHAVNRLHLLSVSIVPLNLLVILVIAIVLFHFIEEPCRKAMRKAYPTHKQQSYPVI